MSQLVVPMVLVRMLVLVLVLMRVLAELVMVLAMCLLVLVRVLVLLMPQGPSLTPATIESSLLICLGISHSFVGPDSLHR